MATGLYTEALGVVDSIEKLNIYIVSTARYQSLLKVHVIDSERPFYRGLPVGNSAATPTKPSCLLMIF